MNYFFQIIVMNYFFQIIEMNYFFQIIEMNYFFQMRWTTSSDHYWDELLLSDHWDELLLSDYCDELLLPDHWDELLLSDYLDELLLSDYCDELLLTYYSWILPFEMNYFFQINEHELMTFGIQIIVINYLIQIIEMKYFCSDHKELVHSMIWKK